MNPSPKMMMLLIFVRLSINVFNQFTRHFSGELRSGTLVNEYWDCLFEIFSASCLRYLCYLLASSVSSKVLCGSYKVILPEQALVFVLICLSIEVSW